MEAKGSGINGDKPQFVFRFPPLLLYARVCMCVSRLFFTFFSSQLTADGMIGGPEWGTAGDLVTFGTHTAHLTDVALFVQLLFGFVLQLADILHG